MDNETLPEDAPFADQQQAPPASPAEETAAAFEPADPPACDPAFAGRRQRIFEHRATALEEVDPLVACLAGVTSDLLDMQLVIGERVRQNLSAEGGSLDVIERNEKVIDLQLRFAKQIAQLAQLERRARRDGGEEEPPVRREAKK